MGFVFSDTETTGTNPKFDQILGFCSVRTDNDLNPVEGGEVVVFAKPRLDVVASPFAVNVHKIKMSDLERDGVSEFELARIMYEEFLKDGNTAIAAYNGIAFDDEMYRHTFYRCMKNPYKTHYNNGNYVFDVYHLVMAVRAIAPSVLKWPMLDGAVSLKLDRLAPANGYQHENAHDARDDVYATIHVARIIKEARPELFEEAQNLSKKRYVHKMLFDAVNSNKPLLHMSRYYGKDSNYAAPILPVYVDTKKNECYAVDLRKDTNKLYGMSVDEVRHQLFTSREELGEDKLDLGLIKIRTNKQPMLFDISLINDDHANEHLDFVLSAVEDQAKTVRSSQIAVLAKEVFNVEYPEEQVDPYEALYKEFIGQAEEYQRDLLTETVSFVGGEDSRSPVLAGADIKSYAEKTERYGIAYSLMLRAKWNNFCEQNIEKVGVDPVVTDEFVRFMSGLRKLLAHEDCRSFQDLDRELTELPEEAHNDEAVKDMVEFYKARRAKMNELYAIAKEAFANSKMDT